MSSSLSISETRNFLALLTTLEFLKEDGEENSDSVNSRFFNCCDGLADALFAMIRSAAYMTCCEK